MFDHIKTAVAHVVLEFFQKGFATLFSSLLSAWWAVLLKNEVLQIPGGSLSLPPPGAPERSLALGEMTNQIVLACGIVLVISFVFSTLWVALVVFRAPATPSEAERFRKYWLLFAAGLLVCVTIFFEVARTGVGVFFRLNALEPPYNIMWLAALAATSLSFLYAMSVLCSPPTVISAIPLGRYVARARW